MTSTRSGGSAVSHLSRKTDPPRENRAKDDSFRELRQPVVARSIRWLRRWCRWRCPWLPLKIKEFAHVHPRGIALVQIRQTESRLDHLQHRGAVSHCVRDIVFFGERRNHHHGNSKPVTREVALRIWRIRSNEVLRRNAIRIRHIGRRWRNVIVEAAALVIDEDEG